MSLVPSLDPISSRKALEAHVARKLGWTAKAAAHLLSPLATRDIVSCSHTDPDRVRAGLFGLRCVALSLAAAARGEVPRQVPGLLAADLAEAA